MDNPPYIISFPDGNKLEVSQGREFEIVLATLIATDKLKDVKIFTVIWDLVELEEIDVIVSNAKKRLHNIPLFTQF